MMTDDDKAVRYAFQVMHGHTAIGTTDRFIATAIEWLVAHDAAPQLWQEGDVKWVAAVMNTTDMESTAQSHIRLDVAIAEAVADVAEYRGIEMDAWNALMSGHRVSWIARALKAWQ